MSGNLNSGKYRIDHSTAHLRWHANDGYLLEQYRDEDKSLLTLPDEG